MYKYTRAMKFSWGTGWRFVAPVDARKAGVVRSQTFRDGRAARYEIPRLIEKVEAFRRGELSAGNIGPNSTLTQVYKYYTTTNHFRTLAYSSQKNYDSTMSAISATPIQGKKLGSIKVKDVTCKHCDTAYQYWSNEVSISKANQCSRILSLLFNFCISIDMIKFNPVTTVIKKTHKPVSTVWTHKQVLAFLDVAFADYKHRSIGLVVTLCYEWAQRPNDIRLLKWGAIDFDKARATITQTKRGATVELPISEHIMHLLQQQKTDWDFQEYVIPFANPSNGGYRPLSRVQISLHANEVKALAALPTELVVGNLRKSGIVEMIDAGVDHLQIMSVTGHQNVSSLNPYQKHTYSSAKSALDRRRQHSEGDIND